MRLKSELWVQGYLQKLNALLIPAFVTRKGHRSAGAIYIKINHLNSLCQVLSPAPTSFEEDQTQGQDDRRWTDFFDGKDLPENEADQWLREQASYDTDIWIIEIEDKNGESHLEQSQITTL